MSKHQVKLRKDHGPHEAGSVIEVSDHTFQTFRDRMEPVSKDAGAEGGDETKVVSIFGSPQAEKLAAENNVAAATLKAWRKPSGETGYTKPDVQAYLDERAAAEEAEAQRRAAEEAETPASGPELVQGEGGHPLPHGNGAPEGEGATGESEQGAGFASEIAAEFAAEKSVTLEVLREQGAPTGSTGYTKADVQSYVDAQAAGAEGGE